MVKTQTFILLSSFFCHPNETPRESRSAERTRVILDRCVIAGGPPVIPQLTDRNATQALLHDRQYRSH
jgi:hypothetical protein